MALQTEFEFILPLGYVDREGNVHKQGTMRLATAMDEITPLSDMRVQSNEAYLVIVLLTRVVTGLGSLRHINTSVIESLFAADLAYLQEFYRQINETGQTLRSLTCPHCDEAFDVNLANLGGQS
jgi:hypothetical protein